MNRRRFLASLGLASLIAKAADAAPLESAGPTIELSPPTCGVGRLIHEACELTPNEVATLFRAGSVPGVCEALGWRPMDDTAEDETLTVVNAAGDQIATIAHRRPDPDAPPVDW